MDLAVIVVPADQVRGVIDECGAKGVRGLVVISAGFAETGASGAAAQRELVAAARGSGMRMVGPNCMGILNTAAGISMNATFAPTPPIPGRLAFSSQSGGLGIAVLEEAERRGLGLSSFVSVGNKADVSSNDLLRYWKQDEATDVIMLYLESFGNPRQFARIAREVSQIKPIVAVKAGRTVAGSRAASSHTAALASPDAAVDALFAQTGVIRVDTLEELFDVAQVLSDQPLPAGRRVGIVTNSGGPGILAADACEANGLVVPELTETTQAALRGFLSSAAGVRNPVDLVASGSSGRLRKDDSVAARRRQRRRRPGDLFTPPLVTQADDVATAVATASEGAGKPIVANFVSSPLGATVSDDRDPSGAVLCLSGIGRTSAGSGHPIRPVAAAAAPVLGQSCPTCGRLRPEQCRPGRVDRDRPREAGSTRQASPTCSAPTASLFHRPGRRDRRRGRRGRQQPRLSRRGQGARHRSDPQERCRRRPARAVRRRPTSSGPSRPMRSRLGDRMQGVVVQPMADPGVETIVGLIHDESFGPLVLFGTGGTAVELFGDRTLRVLPITDVDASELVRSLRSSPLLFGYRGAPAVDVAGLEDLLVRVGPPGRGHSRDRRNGPQPGHRVAFRRRSGRRQTAPGCPHRRRRPHRPPPPITRSRCGSRDASRRPPGLLIEERTVDPFGAGLTDHTGA